MDYADFRASYPLLNTVLIDWAAHRIAGTQQYLEGEIRGKICSLQHQKVKVEIKAGTKPNDDESKELLAQLDQHLSDAEVEFKNIKAVDITPSQMQLNQAIEEVKDYAGMLGLLDTERFLSLNLRISAKEKFLLSALIRNGASKSIKALIDRNWAYLDERSYSILAEPVKQHFIDTDGRLYAFVTENSYRASCLNSPQIMFVDIDINNESYDMTARALPWGRQCSVEKIMQTITNVAKNWDLKFCTYLTKNGFRLIELSREWEPQSHESRIVLAALGSDPLFQQLCFTQGTYRARLTIKPWRDGDTVCRIVGTTGEAPEIPLARKVRMIHDTWTLTGEDLA